MTYNIEQTVKDRLVKIDSELCVKQNDVLCEWDFSAPEGRFYLMSLLPRRIMHFKLQWSTETALDYVCDNSSTIVRTIRDELSIHYDDVMIQHVWSTGHIAIGTLKENSRENKIMNGKFPLLSVEGSTGWRIGGQLVVGDSTREHFLANAEPFDIAWRTVSREKYTLVCESQQETRLFRVMTDQENSNPDGFSWRINGVNQQPVQLRENLFEFHLPKSAKIGQQIQIQCRNHENKCNLLLYPNPVIFRPSDRNGQPAEATIEATKEKFITPGWGADGVKSVRHPTPFSCTWQNAIHTWGDIKETLHSFYPCVESVEWHTEMRSDGQAIPRRTVIACLRFHHADAYSLDDIECRRDDIELFLKNLLEKSKVDAICRVCPF